MKRVLTNDARAFKDEMVEGFLAAYGRYVRRVPDASGVMAVGAPRRGKVSVLIGGGSGHYPAFAGTVGQGLADGAVIGDIFTSPSAEQVYRCTKALDGGAGVLLSYGNYSGDVMNFDMAQARCRDEGMDVRTVIVTDDVASAPKGREEERRGVAGDLYVFKVAGAAAARGDDMDGVEEAAQRANAVTRSIGIAFAGCTLPGQTEPLFTVEPGKMEVGMGVHGEPGIRTADLLPARGIAELLVDTLLEDAPEGVGSRAAVMLNGLGSTKYEELFVLFSDVNRLLGERGVEVHEPLVGELVTSLDMAGCSLTLMWLDGDLQELHDAPAATPAFSRGSLDLPQETGETVSSASSSSAATPDASAVHRALDSSLAALRDLGKAEPGDKTMIDTLDPFVRSFGETAGGGASLDDAWRQALPAAEKGADSTADMISTRGRASKLGERSRGHKDPGAVSMLYVLRAAGDALPKK